MLNSARYVQWVINLSQTHWVHCTCHEVVEACTNITDSIVSRWKTKWIGVPPSCWTRRGMYNESSTYHNLIEPTAHVKNSLSRWKMKWIDVPLMLNSAKDVEWVIYIPQTWWVVRRSRTRRSMHKWHEMNCERIGALLKSNSVRYGVATISRLLKIIGFFCKRAL